MSNSKIFGPDPVTIWQEYAKGVARTPVELPAVTVTGEAPRVPVWVWPLGLLAVLWMLGGLGRKR